jgi:hypothetical protein
MLVAFQGFTAPPGGKKTVAGMENVFVGEYKFVAITIALSMCNIIHSYMCEVNRKPHKYR